MANASIPLPQEVIGHTHRATISGPVDGIE